MTSLTIQKVRKKKAIVFVMSDFLDDGYEKNVKLISRMHDLRLIMMTDPIEERFSDKVKGIFKFRGYTYYK